jgi:hypothetical protein
MHIDCIQMHNNTKNTITLLILISIRPHDISRKGETYFHKTRLLSTFHLLHFELKYQFYMFKINDSNYKLQRTHFKIVFRFQIQSRK